MTATTPEATTAAPARAAAREETRKRVLDVSDRTAEVLFGLIMVLTFTGTLGVATAGRDDVRAMLIGALGCNFAWGVIDGVLYLMGCLAERGRSLAAYRAARESEPSAARRHVAGALPPLVASLMTEDELESLRQRLLAQPEPPAVARLNREDWLGAFAVFLLVFLSTFPVVLPFLFLEHASTALRVSNAIALTMLFLAGAAYAKAIGRRPWLVGFAMLGLGLALVALTIALGG